MTSYVYHEVEQPPAVLGHAQPRALQMTEDQLQRKSKRRNYTAVMIFIGSLGFMGYLTAMTLGSGGVGFWDDSATCDRPPAGSFQSFVTLDWYLIKGLSFSTAKTIDVVLDLVLGQGGRVLHSWIVVNVFSDAFTRMLESVPATYQLYLAAKLDPVCWQSGIAFVKGIFSVAPARYKWLMAWFSFATPSKTISNMPNGVYFDYYPLAYDPGFRRLATTCILVQNGPAINFPINVTITPSEYDDAVWGIVYSKDWGRNYPYPFVNSSLSVESQLWRNLSNYVSANMHIQGNHTFEMDDFNFDRVFWINGANLGPRPNGLIWDVETCWNGTILVTAELPTSCIQLHGYVYGLSSNISVLFVILEVVWIIGMFGIWWDANAHSELNRRGWRRNGMLRSIVDLMEPVNTDIGPQACSYSDAELMKAVEGKKIGYYVERADAKSNKSHLGLSSTRRTQVKLEQSVTYG